jgi:UDP-glucose 4-epimerase
VLGAMAMNKLKKVLILGGGGFIGSNIAKYLLLHRDYNIDIVDNFSRSSSTNIPLLNEYQDSKRLRIYNEDLTNLSSFNRLDTDYDYVYMLAAMVGVDKVNAVPHEVIRVNSLLVINCLEWLKNSNCKRIVFSSTSETYAGTIEAFDYDVPTDEKVPLTIEDIGHSRFTYAITKMLGESGFINYAKQGYFEAVIVRYHNVYGPMMGFRHVIPHLVERFRKNESPFLIYGHDQTRSFNFIEDAV